MIKTIDTVSSLTLEQAQQFKADGYVAVGVYINRVTKETVQNITAAGLSVISIYETNPTSIAYFVQGQGTHDAKAALEFAKALGMPPGKPIYFPTDFDIQLSNLNVIRAYYNEIASAIAPYIWGDYGSFFVVENVDAPYSWQTAAWSGGKVSTKACMLQDQFDETIHSVQVDVDGVYKEPGWWPTPKESTMQKFDAVKALVNGSPVKAVGVVDARTEITHLIWTVARDTGCNLTKVEVDDVEIDGKKPAQVFDGTDTYLRWSDIPSLDPRPEPLPGGGFNFLTRAAHPKPLPQPAPTPQPAPAPVTPPAPPTPPEVHNYTLVVYENDQAVAGEWVTISVETKDNGQPLGNQTVILTENGQNPQTLITDATTGGAGWGINETTATTDTIEVKWSDPAGVLHSVTKTTTFTVPESTDALVPSDDNVVVRIPMLPDSDPSNAIFFNITAPNGEDIKVQLDTGAFELMFTADSAKTLALTNEGALSVQGVGGSASAYYSHADFAINGVNFSKVNCVVEDSFQGLPLFGYRFFVDNGYDLLISQKHNQIVVMKGAN